MVILTGKKRPQNDFYETPFDLAEAIAFRHIRVKPAYVLDPGCGNGVFGYAMRSVTDDDDSVTIHGVDIDNRELKASTDPYTKRYTMDYMLYNPTAKYDVIIGNPPYSLAEEFIMKSKSLLEEDGVIIFLLKLAFLESVKRGRWLFKDYPPSIVDVLMNRPSFDGTGRTNDYAFAVFIWGHERLYRTEVTWFDWKGM